MDEKWIKDIKQKLESHSRNVPADLWESIEHDMAAQQKKPVLLPYRRIFIAAAAAIVVALIIMPFLMYDTQLSAPETTTSIIAENNTPLPYEPASGSLKTETQVISPTTSVRSATQQPHYNVADDDPIVRSVSEPEPDCNLPVDKEPTTQQNQRRDTEKKAEKTSDKINPFEYNNHNVLPQIKKNRKQLTFGIAASNLLQSSQHTQGYSELKAGTVFANVLTAEGMKEGESHPDRVNLRDIMISNLNNTPETNIRHKFPVRVSVSIQYPLSDIVSLETGLTYTHLSSTLTSGSARNRYETDQTLNYIGLPVKASFAVWETGRLKFYLTAGGMMEKCVSGKSDTDYYVDNKLKHSTGENVMDRPLQFSANAAAGIQASMTRHTAFYIEPGLSYYFDNGSDVENIYKDKPLNFSLNLGFRVTLGK